MNDQIKIGLLAVIAVALSIQVFLQLSESDGTKSTFPSPVTVSSPATNNPTTVTPPANQLNPIETPSGASQTTASYSETEVDLGNLAPGVKVKHTFQVTNTGSNPLNLNTLNADPGLTVLNYTNTPIAPGETGSIEVELNTDGLSGEQTVRVHVNSNADPGHLHLNVKSNVE